MMGRVFYEHNTIKNNELPIKWQSAISKESLEQFLQSNWDQRGALYQDGVSSKKQQFIEFDHRDGIKTKNYIGTIIFNGEQIDIFPKVYQSDMDIPTTESLIKDLMIWLHYCNSANYPFINMPGDFDSSKDTFEIFVAIYLQCIEQVIQKQVYMAYEDVRETGAAVKGKIDFADYATNKYANGQHYLMDYTYSGFVFDNKVNRIIKATCLLINRKSQSKKNKSLVRKILTQFEDVTETICSASDCDTISITGVKSAYKVIMQLSKLFLLNKTASGMGGKLDSFCFLFPTELLFEGFVGGYIKEIYKDYAEVRLQSKSHYLAGAYLNGTPQGDVFQLREDIIIENDDFRVVLDTKYKMIKPLSQISSFNKLGIEDADIKQMVVYAIENDAIELYLVYPLSRFEEPDEDEVYYKVEAVYMGIKYEMNVNILRVPFTFSEDEKRRLAFMDSITKNILAEYVKAIDAATENI